MKTLEQILEGLTAKGQWEVADHLNIQSGPIGSLAYVSTAVSRGRTLAEAKANAAYIARAASSFPALVRALEDVLTNPGHFYNCNTAECNRCATARAALAGALKE